eukprot:3560776-Rhodomonas_salina.1
MVTLREIEKGEALTVNYGEEYKTTQLKGKCLCSTCLVRAVRSRTLEHGLRAANDAEVQRPDEAVLEGLDVGVKEVGVAADHLQCRQFRHVHRPHGGGVKRDADESSERVHRKGQLEEVVHRLAD